MHASTEENQKATLEHINTLLHDMCQPLTALQCRLEMAEMIDTDADYREAVVLGISQCARLSKYIQAMRELLRAANPAGDPEN